MKSFAHIETTEAQRIAKRLLNHWKHKFEVNETDNQFSIFMPEATVILTALTGRLSVQIDTENVDNSVLENVVLEHLNRMAHQDFQTNWTHTA